MRTIKFRAWDGEKMLMPETADYSDICFELDCQQYSIKAGASSIYVRMIKEMELMQFTGLTDYNGVDIYEGDVVENTIIVKNFDNRTGKYKYHVDIEKSVNCVEYDINWCCFNFTKQTERGRLKIIGNKFENPELMEAK